MRPHAATQLEPCRRVLGNNGIPIDRKKYASCSKHDEVDDGVMTVVEQLMSEMVDRIDLQVGQARDHVESGREQLRQAEASQKSARRKKFILAALLAGVAIIVIVILLFSFL